MCSVLLTSGLKCITVARGQLELLSFDGVGGPSRLTHKARGWHCWQGTQPGAITSTISASLGGLGSLVLWNLFIAYIMSVGLPNYMGICTSTCKTLWVPTPSWLQLINKVAGGQWLDKETEAGL